MGWTPFSSVGIGSVILSILVTSVFTRLLIITYFARPKSRRRRKGEQCQIAIFLGSGGHTSEMMQLVKTLPTNRYNSRTYIVTKKDHLSMEKALEYEKWVASSPLAPISARATFDFIQLPRARNVHQRWISTPLTVMIAFFAVSQHFNVLHSILHQISTPKQAKLPDAILMNGPGTCVPIVASVYILRVHIYESTNKFFGQASPRLVYVESFARVSSLSLTAKILRHFVDLFIVQWPDTVVSGAEYRGILV